MTDYIYWCLRRFYTIFGEEISNRSRSTDVLRTGFENDVIVRVLLNRFLMSLTSIVDLKRNGRRVIPSSISIQIHSRFTVDLI